MEQPLEAYFRFLIGIFSVVLLAIGGFIALTDKTRSAVTPLAFGVLLMAMVFLSKFRHFEFWTLKFETWDQKQVEAAELVDRLRLISDGTSTQVALLAAKIGLWDSGFNNLQLESLITQVHALLDAAGVAKSRQEEILNPTYQRVHLNLFFAALKIINLAFEREEGKLNSEIRLQTDPVLQSKLQGERSALQGARGRFMTLQNDLNAPERNAADRIAPTIAFVANTALAGDTQLTTSLQELKSDDDFFAANHTLRRKIDLNYLER